MRKIPITMATQHPDSASKFVSVNEEVGEAIDCLKRKNGLRCDEYMVDYMSKLTPYHQLGKIILRVIDETDLIPGKDVFITPRMVSSFYEEPFRQLMTLLAVIEAIYHSIQRYDVQGIVEIVQAMTETVDELKKCKERCDDFYRIIKKELRIAKEGELRLIPLFEGIAQHLSIPLIVEQYISRTGVKDYMRIFIGKSETAMLSGHPASILSCKIALAHCYRIQEESGLEVFPILGGGALPFRGHFTLENSNIFLNEYRGTKTYTIQSGMRYDHGKDETIKLIEKLKEATNKKPLEFDEGEKKDIVLSLLIFAKHYLKELQDIIEEVIIISNFVPNQRERLLGYQDVSYYRELRNIKNIANVCHDKQIKREILGLDLDKFLKLPRAIKLSAALYSSGLPPEFIGTGNALLEIKERLGNKWLEELLEDIMPSLRTDIKFASKYFSGNYLLTKRISESVENLKAFFEFNDPDERHEALVDMTTFYLKNIKNGKRSAMPKKFAIQIANDEISEYLGGSIESNLEKLILDMGKIRNSLG
ncbi:MAG: phosphoenolpyruvate carboxylase [Candidatus Bathyarchaeia archaeon]